MTNKTNPTSRRILVSWLIGSTKDVLKPVAGSTLARIVDQLAGIALFAVPAIFICNLVTSRGDCGCELGTPVHVVGLLIMMVIMAGIKGLARYLEQYWGHLVAFKALELLRSQVYRETYPQAPAIVTKTRSGDLLARLTKDIDRIEVFFAHTFAPAVSALVVPVIVTVVTFVVAPWQLGLVVAALLTVALMIPWLGINSGHRVAVNKLTVRGQVTAEVTDSLGGIAEVLGYGLENSRLQRDQQLGEELVDTSLRDTRISAFRVAFLAAWRMLALLAILAVGIPLFRADNLSLSAWIAVAFAVLRCWDCINAVANFGQELNISFAAAGRVYRLTHAGLELPEGTRNVSASPALDLEFRAVGFSYLNHPTAPGEPGKPAPGTIAGVNLKAEPGKWTVLAGPTGSGKSTLARLALRFFDPEAGEVLLDGVDVRGYCLESLRQAISLVSAETTLFDLSIAGNLRLAKPEASEAQLWWALRMVGMDQEVRAMQGGLNHRIGGRGNSLSGGQRQRLSLAQALLREAPVLILDEFTAHLHPALAQGIYRNLSELQHRPTILEITHNLDQVAAADWVAVMDLGEIVEQGRPADLLADRVSALSRLQG